jgi:cell wall assembly regulator SMI1
MADPELQSVLAELEDWIRERHPDLHPRLRPGLSERELGLLAHTLRPYHLPVELEVLHRWHDGWESWVGGEYRALLPDASFESLPDAILGYRGWLETLGTDGWHPLWFPAFGNQSGELVVLQFEPGRPAGQVYAFHSEADLSTSYDSVTALFATTLDLWQRGLLPDDRAYPEIRRLAAPHNPRSRLPDGVSRQEISRSSTRDWPAAWREAIGVRPQTPAAEAELVTIAELAADPECGRPVRAELKGIGGSRDRFFASASDPTGAVTVFFMREETENFREASGGGRHDLWLTPLAEWPADYLATKVVSL